LHPKETHKTSKTINASVERVTGVGKGISLKVGEWFEKMSFTIVPMDYFEVVLGQELMRK